MRDSSIINNSIIESLNPIMFKLKATSKKVEFKKKRDYCAKKKIRKLQKYLRSELAISTTHGLPYIVNAELHWFERIFWSVSFVFCAALIFMLLAAQYRRFVEAPIVMSVEMDYFNWNVSYPAIYLCPLEKADDFLLNTLVNDTLRDTGKDIGQYLDSIVTVTLESINRMQVPDSETLSLINSSEYATIAADIFKRLSNSTLTTVGPWPVNLDISMTEMGMCDVINSNVAAFDNLLKWSDTEVTFTRKNVELSFHDRDFFVQLMNYADSYKIYIQSPNDIIQITSPSSTFDDEGFLHFGVQMSSTRASKNIRSLSLHLRKCRFIEETDSRRHPVYTYTRCLLECRIKMIVKLCGCVPHFYKPLEYEKVCNLAELKCLEDYIKEIQTISVSNETMAKFENTDGLPRNSRDCGCLDNCEYTFYQTANEVFLPQALMNRLRIIVANFPKVRITREIIFGFYDIFLRSGGVVNLCIGASVISVMELIMTALRIPIYELVQVLQCIYTRRQKAKAWKEKKNK